MAGREADTSGREADTSGLAAAHGLAATHGLAAGAGAGARSGASGAGQVAFSTSHSTSHSTPHSLHSTHSGQVLPIVTRGHTGFTTRDTAGRRSKTAKGVDFGEEASWSDDDEWPMSMALAHAKSGRDGREDMTTVHTTTSSQAHTITSNTRATTTTGGAQESYSRARPGAVSTSPTMNFSNIYERARVATRVTEGGDDVEMQRIWSARFAHDPGGVVGGLLGIGGAMEDEDKMDMRSASAPPNRNDFNRSASSLLIGNNAQLYLPPGPRGASSPFLIPFPHTLSSYPLWACTTCAFGYLGTNTECYPTCTGMRAASWLQHTVWHVVQHTATVVQHTATVVQHTVWHVVQHTATSLTCTV